MRSHWLWTKKQRMPLLTISKVNMFWNCLNFAVSLLFFYTCTWIKYHCCRRCSRRAGLLCFAEEWAVGSRNRKDPRSPDGGQTSAIVPAREEESLLCMEVSDSLGHPCLCSDQTSVCSNDAPLLFSTRSTPKACHQKTAPTSLPTRYHPSAIKGKSAVWALKFEIIPALWSHVIPELPVAVRSCCVHQGSQLARSPRFPLKSWMLQSCRMTFILTWWTGRLLICSVWGWARVFTCGAHAPARYRYWSVNFCLYCCCAVQQWLTS